MAQGNALSQVTGSAVLSVTLAQGTDTTGMTPDGMQQIERWVKLSLPFSGSGMAVGLGSYTGLSAFYVRAWLASAGAGSAVTAP